jgi:hypothetical protein
MDCSTGWLLDASIEQNRATIWIKTEVENAFRLLDTYQPNFYVLPKDENIGAELFHLLSQQFIVKNTEWEDKFTDLFEDDKHGIKKLTCIYAESLLRYKTLLKSLEKDPRVAQLFNTDLSHIQQYLFTNLRIEPTSKVQVYRDRKESRLIRITKIDEDLVAAPPPFSSMYFEIHSTSSTLSFDDDANDPITEPDIKKDEKSALKGMRIQYSILFASTFWLKIQIFSFLQTSIPEGRLSLIIYL